MVEIIRKPLFSEMLERGRNAPHLFAQDFLNVECHPGQIGWLMRANWIDDDGRRVLRVRKPNAREGALACSNRWGKTFISAVKVLHRAFYQIRPEEYRIDRTTGMIRDYRVANIAMSLDQSMLAFNEAYRLATSPKSLLKRYIIDHKSTPFPLLALGRQKGTDDEKWRSDIWARSTAKGARYLLGHNFNFINWDEAAFDPAVETDVVDQVIRMRLTDQAGKLDFISSPNGYNKFQAIHALGGTDDPRFYSFSGTIFDNAKALGQEAIAYIREQMQKMHPDWVLQNIWGQFAKMSNLFPVESVMRCYTDIDWPGMWPRRIEPNMRFVEKKITDEFGREHVVLVPQRTENALRYVIGADLARKQDKTAIVVLQLPETDWDPLKVVYFELLEKRPWRFQYERITKLSREYNNAPVIVDSTGLGDVVLEDLQSDPYNLNADGRLFSKSGKENLITQLQDVVQSTSVVFPFHEELVRQLTYYQWDDKKLETDGVMGLALAVEAAKVALGDSWERLDTADLPIVKLSRDPETMMKNDFFMDEDGRTFNLVDALMLL